MTQGYFVTRIGERMECMRKSKPAGSVHCLFVYDSRNHLSTLSMALDCKLSNVQSRGSEV